MRRPVAFLAALALVGSTAATEAVAKPSGRTVLKGDVVRLNGERESLAKYRGKVVLVVNTASQCGFRGQLGGLQELYASRRSRGLVVLGFPSDDFEQEPLDGAEQASFCKKNFGVEFPMFKRTRVLGPSALRLFERLNVVGGAPSYNFTKYLLDRRGRFVSRFDTRVEPTSNTIKRAVDRLL